MRTLVSALLLMIALAGCAAPDPGGDVATPTPRASAPPVVLEDFQEFALGPGQDIEWKYRLDEGAQMTFTWSAGRPVRFDFHGDYDDGTDDFVSHEKGTLATDQGSFTAPFTGRHGWYFANPNSQPVTVTLEAQGGFEVVGRTGGNAP